MRFLLDTNVLSEPALERPNPRVLTKLAQYQGVVATASTALHELVVGATRLPEGKRRQKIEEYIATAVLEGMPILPYDTEAAEWHAAQRARLEAVGSSPSFPDGQIASIAAVHELTLVTRNVSDFKGFTGLQVISWHGK